MSTLHSVIAQGYAVQRTLPLVKGKGEYRIEGVTRDPQERYVLYDGFVDPVTAPRNFAFTHVKAEAMSEPLLTPDAYEVGLHCIHQQVEYGRTIPLLNGSTQEVQIHEVDRPSLSDLAVAWTGDAKATWAIEPPATPGGDGRLYLLAPAKPPVPAPAGGIEDDDGLHIGSLRIA